jgi:pimeloyl-ACP methyl ester carboxylesterase
VLLHGFGLDTRMWKLQVEEFSKAFSVLRYDLRGYGKSSTPTQAYSHVDDLQFLLERLNIHSCHILGFSIGGVVAIDFEIKNPSYVKSLIVANAMPSGFKRVEGPVTSSAELKELARSKGVGTAKEVLLAHRIFSYTRKKPDVERALFEMIDDYSGWHWLNTDLATHLNPPAAERLSDILIPTLVLTSEFDGLDPRRAADYLAKNIPIAEKILLHGVGHMSNMEDPDLFNSAIKNFLSKQDM